MGASARLQTGALPPRVPRPGEIGSYSVEPGQYAVQYRITLAAALKKIVAPFLRNRGGARSFFESKNARGTGGIRGIPEIGNSRAAPQEETPAGRALPPVGGRRVRPGRPRRWMAGTTPARGRCF